MIGEVICVSAYSIVKKVEVGIFFLVLFFINPFLSIYIIRMTKVRGLNEPVRYRYSLHRSRALIPRGRRTRRSSSSGREGGKNPGLRAAV